MHASNSLKYFLLLGNVADSFRSGKLFAGDYSGDSLTAVFCFSFPWKLEYIISCSSHFHIKSAMDSVRTFHVAGLCIHQPHQLAEVCYTRACRSPIIHHHLNIDAQLTRKQFGNVIFRNESLSTSGCQP